MHPGRGTVLRSRALSMMPGSRLSYFFSSLPYHGRGTCRTPDERVLHIGLTPWLLWDWTIGLVLALV